MKLCALWATQCWYADSLTYKIAAYNLSLVLLLLFIFFFRLPWTGEPLKSSIQRNGLSLDIVVLCVYVLSLDLKVKLSTNPNNLGLRRLLMWPFSHCLALFMCCSLLLWCVAYYISSSTTSICVTIHALFMYQCLTSGCSVTRGNLLLPKSQMEITAGVLAQSQGKMTTMQKPREYTLECPFFFVLFY